MEPRSHATEVVRRAEDELRQLLVRAAEQGDYEFARLLADWAKQLKQMVQDNGSSDGKSFRVEAANETGQSKVEPEIIASRFPNLTDSNKAKGGRPGRTKKAKVAQREYPKFLRDGQELVKIGWSKREKKSYRHKAPQRVVLLICQVLQQAGRQGNRFVMEQILPIRDPENDAEVPSYQAYLSLAWLRKENLIVQHGRQGYSLPSNVNLTNAVEERWKLLPKS